MSDAAAFLRKQLDRAARVGAETPYALVAYLPGPLGIVLRHAYWKRRLKALGSDVKIGVGVQIYGPEHVVVGDEVLIEDYVVLVASPPDHRANLRGQENPFYRGRPGELWVGAGAQICSHVTIQAHGGVWMGEGAGIASGSKIYTMSHHFAEPGAARAGAKRYKPTSRAAEDETLIVCSPCVMEDGSSMGLNSVMLPGATIRARSWVGAMSLVMGVIPPDVFAAGTPAEVVRTLGQDGASREPPGPPSHDEGGEASPASLAYWRRHLGGAPPALDLPTDRPRPPVQSGRVARRAATIPPDLAAQLDALSRREGITLFVTLLAALYVLLERTTGQRDLTVGGAFGEGTFPLRTELEEGISFRALLQRVRDVCLAAEAHRDVAFDRLVEALAPDRDPSRAPLFQVMLTLVSSEASAEAPPGAPRGPDANLDLHLTMTAGGGALGAHVDYAVDLFDAATIDRMIGHYQVLLGGAAADPDHVLRALPLLSEAERRLLLVQWNTPVVHPRGLTLHGWFEAQVDRTPDAPAATCGGQSLRYRDLDARANRVAHLLQERGVGPGVLVGLATDRSLEMLVGLIGILKAGGAYLPLDPSYPSDRLAFMVEDAKLSVILTEARVAGALPPALAASAELVLLDASDRLAAEPDTRPTSRATPDDLAYVIYTSGSTGKPKGAMIEHHSVVRLFQATDAWYGFGPADVWTMFHSYAFDFSVWEIWGALLYGGRVVVVSYDVSRSPEAFLALLGEERVTVLNQTPTAFRQLIRADEAASSAGGAPALALRFVIFGGEALDLGDLRPWWARRGDRTPQLVNMYGITETTVHVTYRPVGLADLERPWSSVIGLQIPDLSVHILDAERRLVPLGVRGELYVGGDGVARGYLNRPDLTRERFVADPFRDGGRLYKTGDLGRRLASGEIEYLGRVDHQVKIRGYRIELGEVEATLEKHPAVREAVVVVREDTPDDKRLVAYVVAEEGGEHDAGPGPAELRAHLAAHLPEHMIPSAFVRLLALPLTPSGKVDRKALPEPDARAGAGASAGHVDPRNPVEAAIARIWAETLHLDRVGVEDDFFAVGGHSLFAARIMRRISGALGVELPIGTIFDAPTVAALAERVADARRLAGAGAATGHDHA